MGTRVRAGCPTYEAEDLVPRYREKLSTSCEPSAVEPLLPSPVRLSGHTGSSAQKTIPMSVEDHADLKMLGSELEAAVFAQAVDGYVSSPREAEACNRAAAIVKVFVTKPSEPLSHGLGDLAQSVVGIDVLASLIELLRRLLVEAGHANDDLGKATMDYHDLGGIDDAIRLREASNCPAARSLAKSLSLMLSRTEGPLRHALEEIPPQRPKTRR